MEEELEGVGEGDEGGVGGEREEAARREGVVEEAGDGHLGLDLKEGVEVAALVEMGFENGEVDGGFEGLETMG